MGLLDADTEEGQRFLGLLAAAGPQTDPSKTGFGARLLMANDGVQAWKQAKLMDEFKRAQMDNYKSEIEARKLATIKDERQQKMIEDLFGGGAASGQSNGVGQSGQSGQGGQPNLVQLSQQLGIPPQAIHADLVFNGGKKISEMLAERSKPNWQNINGNLVNTNAPGFSGGMQAGMNASADGKVTAWQPDGQGGLVVGAPRGAIDTYNAYKGVDAGLDLVDVPDGNGGQVKMPRSEAVKRLSPSQPQPVLKAPSGYAGGSPQAAAQEQRQIYEQELRDPNLSPDLRASIQREISRLPLSNNFGVTISDAEKARQKVLAEGAATRENENITKGNQFKDFGNQITMARTLLQSGPTGSPLGALVDSAVGMVGYSPASANIAKKLETVSGWMIQNIPKAAGAQSDAELRDYKVAAGVVGDKTIPVAQRLAALQTVEDLKNLWESRISNGVQLNTQPKEAQKQDNTPPPVPMKGMVRKGHKYIGGDPSKPSSWVPVAGAEGGW